MNLKIMLYFVNTILAIYALDSVNLSNVFKKNRYYQSRLLFIFLSLSLSYLVTNFLYDFMVNRV